MKKKMKKLMALFAALILCLGVFVGCGSGGDTASEDAIVVKIASDETEDTPGSKATEIFKELVEEKSGGKMVVEFYPNSAMGDEREIAESVNMGNLQMGIISACMLATYDENWYAVDMPFVWEDREHMYSLLDNELGDFYKESIAEKSNLKVLEYADGSFKVLLSGNKEIHEVSDLSDMKLRAQESQMNMSIYNAWDSTAVPMGASEVYTAMQQGTVDGVDTAPLFQVSNKFYELGKSFTMTNHQAILMTALINDDFYNSLDEDMQKVLDAAAQEAYGVQMRQITAEDEQIACDTMEEAGCKKIELTDAGLETFKKASTAVYDEYASKVDPKIYEMMGL